MEIDRKDMARLSSLGLKSIMVYVFCPMRFHGEYLFKNLLLIFFVSLRYE